MRRAFTLIELLVVVAIMGAMVTVGVVSLESSRAGTRVFAAARDVMAMVRRARSIALVTQKPVVVVYSNATIDDEPMARVELRAEKLFSSLKSRPAVRNLAGDTVIEAINENEGEGETLEDILSPQSISADVVRGLKLKVLDESQELEASDDGFRHSKISIFSTADNVSRTYVADEPNKPEIKAADAAEEMQVVFSANGTVNPAHRIWIYPETGTPEKGLCIEVDRFGEPRCADVDGM